MLYLLYFRLRGIFYNACNHKCILKENKENVHVKIYMSSVQPPHPSPRFSVMFIISLNSIHTLQKSDDPPPSIIGTLF